MSGYSKNMRGEWERMPPDYLLRSSVRDAELDEGSETAAESLLEWMQTRDGRAFAQSIFRELDTAPGAA